MPDKKFFWKQKLKKKQTENKQKKGTVWELRSKKITEINKNIAAFEYTFSYPSQVQSILNILKWIPDWI